MSSFLKFHDVPIPKRLTSKCHEQETVSFILRYVSKTFSAIIFRTVIILNPKKHILSVHPTTSTKKISFNNSSVRVIKL